MCGEAVSSLHISPIDFWQSTPNEIYYAIKSNIGQKTFEFHSGWEQMRVQTFYLISIQMDKKQHMDYKKFKRDYMPFAWDENEIIKIEKIDWDARDKALANTRNFKKVSASAMPNL